MAGFPGEAEEDFAELLSFVEEQKFDHLGCFAFSPEEGTVAARMSDQIDEDVKKSRVGRVMKLQREISRQALSDKIGTRTRVLLEGVSEETELLLKARMPTQAPEVDGVVLINDGDVPMNAKFCDVLITGAHDYDLVATVIEAKSCSKGSELNHSLNL